MKPANEILMNDIGEFDPDILKIKSWELLSMNIDDFVATISINFS